MTKASAHERLNLDHDPGIMEHSKTADAGEVPMAMKNEASVEIDRPIEEVFDYTIHNVADWSLTVVRDEPIDTKPDGGVGSTFLCVTEEKGRTMEFQGTVTRHEPPLVSACELIGPQFDIDVLYVFEDLSGRTRVTQVSVVTPKGFMMKAFFGILGPFMKKAGCKAVENEFLSLKNKMEATDTTKAE